MKKILPIRYLRLTVGVFFIVLGIVGILPSKGESVFAITSRYSNLEMIFGIVEFVCGILLIIGLFTLMKKSTVKMASFVILLFWLARIVFSKFINGMTITSSIHFASGFSNWLLVLMSELVIAAAIYVVFRVYE